MRILLSITSNVLNENTVLQKETLRKSLLYTFLLQKPFECHYYANIRPVKNGRNIVRCPFLETLKYIKGCWFNFPCMKILTYNGLIFFTYFYDILFLLSILSLMEDKSLFVEIRIATKWSWRKKGRCEIIPLSGTNLRMDHKFCFCKEEIQWKILSWSILLDKAIKIMFL